MDRTTFNDGARVDQRQLQCVETNRTFHMLRRFEDGYQSGVAEGLTVTANPLNTNLVDIAGGFGYAPNGELIAAALERALERRPLRMRRTALRRTQRSSAPSAHCS